MKETLHVKASQNTSYLIFDFDGTLVDSFNMVIQKFNLLASEFNFRQIQNNEINALRDLTSIDIIKQLEIPIYKIPKVIRSVRKHMHGEIQSLLPFTNMPEVLQALYDKGIPLGILTTNSEENVTEWLERNQMRHLFNFIYVESGFFGKKRILKKIITSLNIDKTQTFYIGDETRDIDAAKGCGVYSVAVTWGFNSEKILTQHAPHFIVRKPEELLNMSN